MNLNFLSQVKRTARSLCFNNVLLNLMPALLLGCYSKIIGEIIEAVMNKNYALIYPKSITLIIIVTLPTVILIIWGYLTNIRIENMKQELRFKFYRSICKQNISTLNNITYGEGKERINDDFSRVTDYYLWGVPNFIVSVMVVLGYTIYMGRSSWIACATLSALACVQCIVPIIITKFLMYNYEEMRKVEEKLTDYVVFSYQGFETIKLFDIRKKYLNKMREIHKRYAHVGIKAELTATSENIMDNFMENVLTYGCYAILGMYVVYHIIDVNISAQMIVISAAFFSAYKNIFEMIQQQGVCQVAERRIYEWTEETNTDKVDVKKISKNITFRQISVCDKSKRNILEIPCFTIDINKKNFIYGSNGCGKSTLIKIMLREIQPEGGRVIYGNLDEKDINDSCISKSFFYLPQKDVEIQLTAKELYENVSAEAERIAMELGVEKSMIDGEQIQNLSQGNRRKIFLALALSFHTKCLVLDEPTNYLDDVGKDVFIEKLKKHTGGFLVISHEKELFQLAECNYGMMDGKIYERNKKKSV